MNAKTIINLVLLTLCVSSLQAMRMPSQTGFEQLPLDVKNIILEYVLADPCPVLDANGKPVLDDKGKPVTKPCTVEDVLRNIRNLSATNPMFHKYINDKNRLITIIDMVVKKFPGTTQQGIAHKMRSMEGMRNPDPANQRRWFNEDILDWLVYVEAGKHFGAQLRTAVNEMDHESIRPYLKLMADAGRSDEVNSVDEEGDTALIIAAKSAYVPAVEELLKSPKIDVNKQDNNGNTALMAAVSESSDKEGRGKIVNMLLRAGAAINKQDKNGATALMVASFSGQ